MKEVFCKILWNLLGGNSATASVPSRFEDITDVAQLNDSVDLTDKMLLKMTDVIQ